MSPIVDHKRKQTRFRKRNSKRSFLWDNDLRSLWDGLPLQYSSHNRDKGRRAGITARGDAAKYYADNGHKDRCVFTHEYVE